MGLWCFFPRYCKARGGRCVVVNIICHVELVSTPHHKGLRHTFLSCANCQLKHWALSAAGLSAHTAQALATGRYPLQSLTRIVWTADLFDYADNIIVSSLRGTKQSQLRTFNWAWFFNWTFFNKSHLPYLHSKEIASFPAVTWWRVDAVSGVSNVLIFFSVKQWNKQISSANYYRQGYYSKKMYISKIKLQPYHNWYAFKNYLLFAYYIIYSNNL